MTTDPPAVTVGVDFGTLSGRALVVAVDDGRELGSAVHEYTHGVLESALPDGHPLRPAPVDAAPSGGAQGLPA